MTTMTMGHLAELAPISLAELVERGALLTRVDRKYVVPLPTAGRLLHSLPDEARVLDIVGRREFGYRSTYLDTPEHLSYLTSGRSFRTRWKVRTRTYLDHGSSWLEVKTRAARGQTWKQRIEHPEADAAGLMTAGRDFVGGVVGAGAADVLRPVLVTSYRRSTLFLPTSGSRVTIDTDLGWTSLCNLRDLDRPGLAIVETKTGSTPSAVDRLMWSWGHRPLRLSKYGVGMAALHPDLPRLKWHRAMQRHLAMTSTS